NSRSFWQPFGKAMPTQYADLYASAAKELKATNPSALVAPGPTGPNSTGMKPIDFIKAVQPLLAARHAPVDAWAHNPYPGGGAKSPRAKFFKAPSVGIGNLPDLITQLDKSPVTRKK